MREIDFRSDTLTLPTQEMLAYMIQAKLGDDGWAKGDKGEDEAAAAAEAYVAGVFGKEDALFVPSGTMANMVSVMATCQRGAKVAVAENTHMYRSEKSVFDPDLCGYIPVFVPQARGVYDMARLEEALAGQDMGLVCVENSYNFEGGCIIPPEKLAAIIALCDRYQVPVHMDGARIFNVAAALQVPVAQLCQDLHSMMFCVSKGLSAPVGSFVLGSRAFIREARQARKKCGGQLRQVGLLAAAGQYAVRHLSARLAEDNARAHSLASSICQAKDISIDMETVQTNIIRADLHGRLSAGEWVDALYREYAVRAHSIGGKAVRFVTYRGVTDEDISEAAERIHAFCAAH